MKVGDEKRRPARAHAGVTHAVPADAALAPTPGGDQTVLAVCGTKWTGPVPTRARAILDELVAHRLVTVVEGPQLARYLGCAAQRPGDRYYLPAELIEMVDGHAPDPITPPDYDLAV